MSTCAFYGPPISPPNWAFVDLDHGPTGPYFGLLKGPSTLFEAHDLFTAFGLYSKSPLGP